jgi:hypothetical protein
MRHLQRNIVYGQRKTTQGGRPENVQQKRKRWSKVEFGKNCSTYSIGYLLPEKPSFIIEKNIPWT